MSDGCDPPEAMIVPRSRFLPELIWAIPIVAALIGGWLAVRAIRAHGPTITVSFRDAAGLVAGKTKLKYRDVEVGEVRDIGFSPDRATVVITAELVREAEPWMVDDTRFWVARARVAVGEVTGLETLLSGAYIGLDVGSSRREVRAPSGPDRRSSSITFRSERSPPRISTATAARSRWACSCGRRSIVTSRPAPGSGRRVGSAPPWTRRA